MSSFSHLENLTGLEIVPYVPNPKRKIGDALVLEKEQSPLVIPLIKHPRREKISRTPNDIVLNDLSFKLPKNCFKDEFTRVEQLQVEATNMPIRGSTRSIFLSRPIKFILPEDASDRIEKANEEAKAHGMVYLPLLDRLEGWTVEKRQRDNSERYDKETFPLQYYHHKKSERKFRSFTEVETFIIDGSSPKDKRPKEMAIDPCTSCSYIQVSLDKNKSPRFDDRKKVENFLKDAWNNLLNSGIQKEDARSSTNDHGRAREFRTEAHHNLVSSFGQKKHRRKTTSCEDFDEDRLHDIMEELKVIMEGKY